MEEEELADEGRMIGERGRQHTSSLCFFPPMVVETDARCITEHSAA